MRCECVECASAVIKTGESGLTVFRLLTKENRWKWVQANARLVYKSGKPDYIIATQRPLGWVWVENASQSYLLPAGKISHNLYPMFTIDANDFLLCPGRRKEGSIWESVPCTSPSHLQLVKPCCIRPASPSPASLAAWARVERSRDPKWTKGQKTSLTLALCLVQ